MSVHSLINLLRFDFVSPYCPHSIILKPYHGEHICTIRYPACLPKPQISTLVRAPIGLDEEASLRRDLSFLFG